MRKVPDDGWAPVLFLPSMGPQHESCGKALWEEVKRLKEALQWGRNMRVAESV